MVDFTDRFAARIRRDRLNLAWRACELPLDGESFLELGRDGFRADPSIYAILSRALSARLRLCDSP
jgi:hypothetical protein